MEKNVCGKKCMYFARHKQKISPRFRNARVDIFDAGMTLRIVVIHLIINNQSIV